MHYGMVIDTKRCVGCNACTVACKMANNVPQDIFWTRALTDGGDMMDTPAGEFPDISMRYITVSCQHCENPACAKVCPVGATYKDPETGVVRQDYDKCIGCRMCMSACPYTGVRSFNWEEPRYPMDFALGDADAPKHQKHVVEKCIFCYQRLARGETPACMDLCPARARHFGDLDDPNSEVSQLIRERSYEQLLPSEGTKPSVYYLV
ncbi:4Fe-4S dicluster domain-containing protein [Gordonibacter urolithinfaciens]|uniref:4Fe-4S dicluster domain-containing protein n=1 Tax=Gordonibacter urolithinfaciens TaxID=1335613 RepID=A0A1Y4FT24_9ACTN|nr:4Fe-4S dicluster domain-containing protein [Gordonibacter urolithinfaciens]MVM54179.1 4Fe-4S dicluster domain-containing protein [Gordonibacter urolithinfaciens]MVN14435.1 4Fe-4S dicluster domain-containing protein [Gordonibacter urolithinfaciens]MVN37774.1 4Fe-4S dicluster domain-containing protein [Gordonibacter urolithinfaciens]MVN55749.1 4Fe-4S dicluster domain-containing protein [Gordonibacter urolithinfaciens]MVN61749.1 4Fe-4S dicluster domain-containing protein [Gordonibacter urolith